MNGDRQSSHVEKGVIMDLVITVIGAGGNMVEAGVFCCVFWNGKFWVLDLEVSLGEGLGDVREGEEERLEVWGHWEDHSS